MTCVSSGGKTEGPFSLMVSALDSGLNSLDSSPGHGTVLCSSAIHDS